MVIFHRFLYVYQAGYAPHLIELDDGKIYRKPLYLMVKTMVSCRFSLKPIHWQRVLSTSLHSWLRLYYWDDRDGVAFCGWWFGPKIGGDQAEGPGGETLVVFATEHAGETRWKLWTSMENHGGLAHVKPMKMWRTWWLKLCGLKHEIFQITIRNVSSTSFHQQNMGWNQQKPGLCPTRAGWFNTDTSDTNSSLATHVEISSLCRCPSTVFCL